jgi:hypothetical protein
MANTPTVPTLPSISPNVDPSVRRAFDILKAFFASAAANGGFGTGTTTQTTVIEGSGGSGGSGGGYSIINPPAPPGITGFTATGAFSTIILSWTDPGYSQYGYVQIWRATSNNLGSAVYVGESTATVFCDIPPNSDSSVTYYYWARVVSYTGLTGPWTGTNGVAASTATNPAYVLENLTNQITSNQLTASLMSTIATAGETALWQDVSGAPQDQSGNLVLKSTFQDGNTGAWAPGATILSGTNNQAFTKSLGLTYQSIAEDNGTLNNHFPVVPGEKLFVRASLSVLNCPYAIYFGVAFYDLNNNSLGAQWGAWNSTPYTDFPATPTSGWITVPSNAVYGTPWIYVTGPPPFGNPGATNLYIGRQEIGATIGAQTNVNLKDNNGNPLVEYTVKADVNGHITGIGLLGGSQSGTVEIVCTDFAIVNNTNPAQLTVPFVVGTIDGAGDTVGISGGLLVDGSITGQKIVGQTISGDLLAASNLITASAQIANGIIDTAHISSLDASVIQTGILNANLIGANSISAADIQSGAIDITKIAQQAVTIDTLVYGEYTTNGSETQSTPITTSNIAMNQGASILITGDMEGLYPGDTIVLTRSLLGATYPLKTIAGVPATGTTTNFNFALCDSVAINGYTPAVISYSRTYPNNKYTNNVPIYGGTGSNQAAGQSFIVPAGSSTFNLGALQFKMNKVGNPNVTDSLTASVYSALNGGTLLATSTPINMYYGLPSSKGLVQFQFASPYASMVAGNEYYVQITRQGNRDTVDYAQLWGYNSQIVGGTGVLTNSSGTWTQGTVDYRIDVYAYITGGESWAYNLYALPTDTVNESNGEWPANMNISGSLAAFQIMR